MLLFINTDLQQLMQAPLVNSPLTLIALPRSPNITLTAQFYSANGAPSAVAVPFDPELTTANIVSASVANPSVITTAGAHGFLNGDTVAINGVGGIPTTINTSSVATTTVITTASAHGLTTGDAVMIAGHTGSVPNINGTYLATVTSSTTFTIPVTVTTAGAGGTVTDSVSTPTTNGSFTITLIDLTHFSIPVNVTAGGLGGTATRTKLLNLRFSAKLLGNYNQNPGEAFIAPGGFVKSGVGSTAAWTGSLNLITTALDAALQIDPTDALTGKASVALMAELSWQGANPNKTNIVSFNVLNDVYKSGDGSPSFTGGVAGNTPITNGNNFVTVVFGTPLASANWHFLGSPTISNTVDSPPSGITVQGLTARSTTGFTIALSGAVDSSNFVLEWVVVPN